MALACYDGRRGWRAVPACRLVLPEKEYMPTVNQLVRKGRVTAKRRTKTLLFAAPRRSGVCTRVYIRRGSQTRRCGVARVRLTNGMEITSTSWRGVTTSRSTPSCSSAAAASPTCRGSGTRSSAPRWTPRASPIAVRGGRSTGPSEVADAQASRDSAPAGRAGLRLRVQARRPGREHVMLHGKKSLAERVVYDALAIVGERGGQPPVEVLERGGQVAHAGARGAQPPHVWWRELPGPRSRSRLAARERSPSAGWWIRPRPARRACRRRSPARSWMPSTSKGNAYKRKDDMYRMAQANKAFAHYRW